MELRRKRRSRGIRGGPMLNTGAAAAGGQVPPDHSGRGARPVREGPAEVRLRTSPFKFVPKDELESAHFKGLLFGSGTAVGKLWRRSAPLTNPGTPNTKLNHNTRRSRPTSRARNHATLQYSCKAGIILYICFGYVAFINRIGSRRSAGSTRGYTLKDVTLTAASSCRIPPNLPQT